MELRSDRKIFEVGILVAILTSLAACGARPGAPSTVLPEPTFPVARVTADQVARAMQQDRFFAAYGRSTLLIQGTVSAVDQRGRDLVVELGTSGPARVQCDLGARVSTVRVGDAITVESVNPQRDVSRVGAAVLLRNCTIR